MAWRFSVVSTDCSCGDDEKGDFETLGEAMRAAKRLVDVEGYEGAAVYDRKQEAWCAGCNVATVMDMNGPASVTHPFWTITCEAEKREPAQRAAALERAQAIERKDSRRRGGCLFRMGPSICLLGSPGGKALDVFFAKLLGSQSLLFRQFGTTRFRRHVHPSPLRSRIQSTREGEEVRALARDSAEV